MMFVPALPIAAAALLVYTATHPLTQKLPGDPAAQGLYFDSVSMRSRDGVTVSGWLLPAIDAHRVLIERDAVYRNRQPAIVLVHDLGQSPQQFLPLLAPLHEEGYVLLVLEPRGDDDPLAARTFGLKESLDVQAAIELLRQQPFVDPERIGLIGLGAGANACLLAFKHDSTAARAVAVGPVTPDTEQVLSRIAPPQHFMRWMRPLCKWAFEISCGVELDELNDINDRAGSAAPPAYRMIPDEVSGALFAPVTIEGLREFLEMQLQRRDPHLASGRE